MKSWWPCAILLSFFWFAAAATKLVSLADSGNRIGGLIAVVEVACASGVLVLRGRPSRVFHAVMLFACFALSVFHSYLGLTGGPACGCTGQVEFSHSLFALILLVVALAHSHLYMRK